MSEQAVDQLARDLLERRLAGLAGRERTVAARPSPAPVGAGSGVASGDGRARGTTRLTHPGWAQEGSRRRKPGTRRGKPDVRRRRIDVRRRELTPLARRRPAGWRPGTARPGRAARLTTRPSPRSHTGLAPARLA